MDSSCLAEWTILIIINLSITYMYYYNYYWALSWWENMKKSWLVHTLNIFTQEMFQLHYDHHQLQVKFHRTWTDKRSFRLVIKLQIFRKSENNTNWQYKEWHQSDDDCSTCFLFLYNVEWHLVQLDSKCKWIQEKVLIMSQFLGWWTWIH